ncbi:MAG: DMT family transporter [Alphaproteobacteria bacterium]|nr:DMT family transporter [Alphaproteobacteria bacterium]
MQGGGTAQGTGPRQASDASSSGATGYATGVACVLGGAFCASLAGVIVRGTVVADAWQILTIRALSFGLVLLVYLAFAYGRELPARFMAIGLPGLVASLMLAVSFVAYVVALRLTTVADTILIISASPMVAALLGRAFLGEAVGRRTWIAMAVALAGVAVMLTSGLLGGTLLGSMVALLCCLCYAGMIVALRAGRATDMTPAACLAGFLALVVCVPAAGSFDLPARDWALGIALGAVQLGLQMILTVRGARAVPAAQVMLLLMIEIVLAPLWVWLAFGEEPGTWSLAGGAIVVAAILWNALGGRRGAASAA